MGPNLQAKQKGVKVGWRILEVADEKISASGGGDLQSALKKAEEGDSEFEVKFEILGTAASDKEAKNGGEKYAKAKVKEIVTEKVQGSCEFGVNWQCRLPQVLMIGIIPSVILVFVYFALCSTSVRERDMRYLLRTS